VWLLLLGGAVSLMMAASFATAAARRE
jgi:hypothetical protein